MVLGNVPSRVFLLAWHGVFVCGKCFGGVRAFSAAIAACGLKIWVGKGVGGVS